MKLQYTYTLATSFFLPMRYMAQLVALAHASMMQGTDICTPRKLNSYLVALEHMSATRPLFFGTILKSCILLQQTLAARIVSQPRLIVHL